VNTNVFQTVVATSASAVIAALFAYFGWLGITVHTMSNDVTEIKTDLKHLTKRVESVEEKLQLSGFHEDSDNMQVVSDF
jgi:hypothetical protein|tara:strand:+ start:1753 stop:1989 length:237 start_codon:yes stop_codon:yes gene_type:complete